MSPSDDAIAARAAVRAAVATTVIRMIPGHGAPTARHLELLSRIQPPPAPSVWGGAEASSIAALLVARARRDVLGEERALIERYFDAGRLRSPAHLPDDLRATLFAAAGEYCAAVGWPQMGAQYGAEALLFAETDALRYRAHAVLGLNLAVNGEYEGAQRHLIEARSLFDRAGWPGEETDYLTLLAEILVAAAQIDAAGLAAAAATLEESQPHDPFWAYTARAARVMQNLFEGDHQRALVESTALCASPLIDDSHRMVRDFVRCIWADVLVALGDPAGALASLSDAQTLPGHAICFAMQRSAALLLLQQEEAVISETQSCVTTETDHCLRTLVPTLLRRALAFARLAERRRARESVAEAVALLHRTGASLTPFLMLPREEIVPLLEGVSATHSELTPTITRVSELLGAVATTTRPAASPGRRRGAALTPAEREIARLIAEGFGVTEIARIRSLSVNTVKTHTRSIYSKIGVTGREAATDYLRSHEV